MYKYRIKLKLLLHSFQLYKHSFIITILHIAHACIYKKVTESRLFATLKN